MRPELGSGRVWIRVRVRVLGVEWEEAEEEEVVVERVCWTGRACQREGLGMTGGFDKVAGF